MPIGILVDDAIVVVENIYRRWLEAGRTDDDLTADAVDEVGNPTILATFTVVAALLPMGFVTRHDGPVHAADPGAVLGGDGVLAVRRLRLRALAGGAGEAEHDGAEALRRGRAPPGRRHRQLSTARSSRRS